MSFLSKVLDLFYKKKPISVECRAYLRAEEELQKRQPPADGSWASWETIPGFKEANEEYKAVLTESVAREWEGMKASGVTVMGYPSRAIIQDGEVVSCWYTPGEVVAWGVRHGRMV